MRSTRTIALAALLLFTLSACRAFPTGFLDADSDPTMDAEPTPITKTFCESSADLRTDVEFLRSVEVSEDGLLQLIVSVDATLGEARTFAALTGEAYRPLVEDVILSLQDLRDIADELEGQETIGAGIATLGESITSVGEAMDVLALQLSEPCTEE